MTPEEWARNVHIRVGCGCCYDDSDEEANEQSIAEAIRLAVAEEREAWTSAFSHGCGCNRCLDAIEALMARP